MKVVFNYPLNIIGDSLNIVVPVDTEVLGIKMVDTLYGSKEPELLVLTDPGEENTELLRIYHILPLQSFDADDLQYLFADERGSYWVANKRYPLAIGA